MCKKMEDGREEYEAAVKQTNTIQSDILGTHLPQVRAVIVCVERSVALVFVCVDSSVLLCCYVSSQLC